MIATHCRLDHALAILGRRQDETRMARLRMEDERKRRRLPPRRGLASVTRNRIADESAKVLIRDFH
jgi:hypothetical protein